MTRRERGRIAVLQARAETLRARLAAGLCTKLDAENGELSAITWAVGVLTSGKLPKTTSAATS